MIEDIMAIAAWIGLALFVGGAIWDLIAAIGMNRLPDFLSRLHAATIGVIGGAFYPLIGISLILLGTDIMGEYRYIAAGSAALTAFLVLLLAPAGSHALARAARRKGLYKKDILVVDQQEEGGERNDNA